MTELFIYLVLAIVFVIVAFLLVRQIEAGEPDLAQSETELIPGLSDSMSSIVTEKIFDATDYRWLREDLGYTEVARQLAGHRKRMALRWLRALRRSFNEIVRVPEPAAAPGAKPSDLSSGHLLWLYLRFHFLVSYAILVVRLFGPYHRLVPSLGWVHPPSTIGRQREPYGPAGVRSIH